jgi:hypothetical protein
MELTQSAGFPRWMETIRISRRTGSIRQAPMDAYSAICRLFARRGNSVRPACLSLKMMLFLILIYRKSLEPVQNLFSNKTRNASTTMERLVVSFLSQFFHNRRHVSSQENDRSTTHRFGSTTKVWSSFLFTTSTVAPIRSLIRDAKCSPV